jgi:hypothetical protein
VSSSVIELNDRTVFAPAAFNQNVRQLAADVLLRTGSNTLEVELRASRGTAVTRSSDGHGVRVVPAELSLGAPGTSGPAGRRRHLTDRTPVDISARPTGARTPRETSVAAVSDGGLVTAVGLGGQSSP